MNIIQHIRTASLALLFAASLIAVPFFAQAYYIDPECSHYITNTSTGSGGYTGMKCTVETLTALGARTDISMVERIDALRDVIAILQARLTEMQAQSSTCFVPQYDLYIGRTDAETGGEVKKLQLWLKAIGYFPDAQGTGYYGEKTAAAVVAWQKAHGMDFVTTKSGVGKMTRAKMAEACK